MNVLLKLSPLVPEFADLCEEDADLTREGLAEVVNVPAPHEAETVSEPDRPSSLAYGPSGQAYFGGAG